MWSHKSQRWNTGVEKPAANFGSAVEKPQVPVKPVSNLGEEIKKEETAPPLSQYFPGKVQKPAVETPQVLKTRAANFGEAEGGKPEASGGEEPGQTAADQLKKLALEGMRIPETLHGFRRPKSLEKQAQFDADMLEHVLKRARK